MKLKKASATPAATATPAKKAPDKPTPAKRASAKRASAKKAGPPTGDELDAAILRFLRRYPNSVVDDWREVRHRNGFLGQDATRDGV